MTRVPLPEGVHRVTALQALAAIPPVLVTFWADPLGTGMVLMAAAVAALGWEGIFAAVRRRPLTLHGVTTCLIVAVLVPGDTALWQVLVGVSLGVILGELIFGGRGFGFVSPATVVLALMAMSFPEVQLVTPGAPLALATLPGALLLLWAGLIPAAVVVGAGAVALGLSAAPLGMMFALSFALVHLIADPVASPVTTVGRWAYGALAGAVVILFSPGGDVTGQGIVFAALLSAVFAPLIDNIVIRAHSSLRRRRAHG